MTDFNIGDTVRVTSGGSFHGMEGTVIDSKNRYGHVVFTVTKPIKGDSYAASYTVGTPVRLNPGDVTVINSVTEEFPYKVGDKVKYVAENFFWKDVQAEIETVYPSSPYYDVPHYSLRAIEDGKGGVREGTVSSPLAATHFEHAAPSEAAKVLRDEAAKLDKEITRLTGLRDDMLALAHKL